MMGLLSPAISAECNQFHVVCKGTEVLMSTIMSHVPVMGRSLHNRRKCQSLYKLLGFCHTEPEIDLIFPILNMII